MKKDFRKLVYFDKETIDNSLQLLHGGTYQKTRQSNSTKSIDVAVSVGVEAELNTEVPFLARLKFLFTGKLDVKYLHEWLSKTSITSTDISLFEDSKKDLILFSNVTLKDIINSLTSLRYVSTLAKIVGQMEQDIDLKELSSLLNDMEGYDVFDVGNNRYVRFNQKAYLSNYKRNDMSMTKLDIYCISVGSFKREDFDYIAKVGSIQTIIDAKEKQRTLLDYIGQEGLETELHAKNNTDTKNSVMLYDAVCAYVSEKS